MLPLPYPIRRVLHSSRNSLSLGRAFKVANRYSLDTERASSLVELTLFVPILFGILFGVTAVSDVLFAKSENSNLSRELANHAMRDCRAVLNDSSTPMNEVDACLVEAKFLFDNLSGHSLSNYASVVTAYDCNSFSCYDSAGALCPTQSIGCTCTCPELESIEPVGTTEPVPVTGPPSACKPLELNPFVEHNSLLLPIDFDNIEDCTNYPSTNPLDPPVGRPTETQSAASRLTLVTRFNNERIIQSPELLVLFNFRKRIFIAETSLRYGNQPQLSESLVAYDATIF